MTPLSVPQHGWNGRASSMLLRLRKKPVFRRPPSDDTQGGQGSVPSGRRRPFRISTSVLSHNLALAPSQRPRTFRTLKKQEIRLDWLSAPQILVEPPDEAEPLSSNKLYHILRKMLPLIQFHK